MQRLRHLRERVPLIWQCRISGGPKMSTRDASSQPGSPWSLEQTVKTTVSKAATAFEHAVSPGSAWSPDKMQDLSGKTYLVTGANSGIGFQAAMELAKRNAVVTIASRNTASGQRSALNSAACLQCG